MNIKYKNKTYAIDFFDMGAGAPLCILKGGTDPRDLRGQATMKWEFEKNKHVIDVWSNLPEGVVAKYLVEIMKGDKRYGDKVKRFIK